MKRALGFTMSMGLAAIIAAGCTPGAAPAVKKHPKTDAAAPETAQSLKAQAAALAGAVLTQIEKEDPGATVTVFDHTVSGLESVRGEFFAAQVNLALEQAAQPGKTKAATVTRAALLDRLKKAGFTSYDTTEAGDFVAIMKGIDCDYALTGNLTEKQYTYLVETRLVSWEGRELLKRQFEVYKQDIVAEKVNAFGRAMERLAGLVIGGYKGFDSHRVAVYEFKESGNRTAQGEQIARELPNYLLKALENNPGAAQFEVLTRSQLDQIVREQRITMGDLFARDNTAFGKLLQATAIISGDIAQREGGIYITAQMVDLKSGAIISSGEVRYTEEAVGAGKPRDVIGDTALSSARDSESGLPLEIVDEKDGAVMVLVPGGLCTVYSFAGEKKEKVEQDIPAFYIDKYEVTNARFCAFLDATGRVVTPEGRAYMDLNAPGSRIKSEGGHCKVQDGFAKHPVVNVTHYGAEAYAAWAGKQLPTQAQWQKAAGWDPVNRQMRTYPWGDKFDGALANHGTARGAEDGSDGFKETAEVGSFEKGASFFKAFNMAGNVWEWCGPIEKKIEIVDSLGTKVQKMVFRAFVMGGSFRKGGDALTTASFLLLDPETVNFSVGFRCVRIVE